MSNINWWFPSRSLHSPDLTGIDSTLLLIFISQMQTSMIRVDLAASNRCKSTRLNIPVAFKLLLLLRSILSRSATVVIMSWIRLPWRLRVAHRRASTPGRRPRRLLLKLCTLIVCVWRASATTGHLSVWRTGLVLLHMWRRCLLEDTAAERC